MGVKNELLCLYHERISMWCNDATFQTTMEDETTVTQLFVFSHTDCLWQDKYSYHHSGDSLTWFLVEVKFKVKKAALAFRLPLMMMMMRFY